MPPHALFTLHRWDRDIQPSEIDMADFNNLLRQLGELDGLTAEPLREKTLDDFRDFMRMPQHTLAVVRNSITSRIIGMASLHLKPLLAHGLLGLVEEVAVDKNCRGAGVADMLDEELRVIARERRVAEIHLTSNPKRVAANKFYERRGYERYDTNHYRLHLTY